VCLRARPRPPKKTVVVRVWSEAPDPHHHCDEKAADAERWNYNYARQNLQVNLCATVLEDTVKKMMYPVYCRVFECARHGHINPTLPLIPGLARRDLFGNFSGKKTSIYSSCLFKQRERAIRSISDIFRKVSQGEREHVYCCICKCSCIWSY